MSAHVEHIDAIHVEVGGAARPGQVDAGGGEDNKVAALVIDHLYEDRSVVIEGRPERLLSIAREMVRVAEQIVEVTMREPSLRALYGITSVEEGGTDLPPQVGAEGSE